MLNYYFLLFVIDGAIITGVAIFLCGTYLLKCCIKAFRQFTKHSVTKSALQMYREIQILANCYNLTNRSTATGGVVLWCIIGSITYSYLSVGNFCLLHPMMLLMCILLMFTSVNQILCAFCMASDVHKNSYLGYKIIEQKLRQRTGGDRKWMKRFWRSCTTIRVDFLVITLMKVLR